jgi:hypothetical protein
VNEGTAIKRLCADLGLPGGDTSAQDWEYQLGDEYRTEPDVYRYLKAYDAPGYGHAERTVLVRLIFDVVDGLLGEDEEAGQRAWSRVRETIGERFAAHEDVVEYWSVIGHDLDDAFALTPFVRELRERSAARAT